MSQDKELEIQMQFLDEASDYLNVLDEALLGITHSGIEADKMNAALRSAHSIKGGAAMMGFEILSALAHRLEDSFKVLKIERQKVHLDASLEQLLLSGVSCLRQVIEWHQHQQTIDFDWLENQAQPIFEQLYQQLGEPADEDAQSMLSPEEGQDIIPLLFQTEVEGCLQRLEAVLAAHDPRLPEELDIMAQELGGLGEMLQLTAFTELCQSVSDHLAVYPQQPEAIAQLALQTWRQSQQLILAGNWQTLPNQLEASPDLFSPVAAPAVTEPVVSIEDGVDQSQVETTHPTPIHPRQESNPEVEVVSVAPSFVSEPAPEVRLPDPPEVRLPDPQPVGTTASETTENTVRVPVKQLEQLNDLFSELIIERNGLDLHLKRLRNLVLTLNRRVKILEESNVQLRDAYDKVEVQGGNSNGLTQPVRPVLPQEWPASSASQLVKYSPNFDVLEMDRYNSLHLLSQEMMETIVQVQEVTSDIDLGLEDAEQTTRELNKTSRQLQTKLNQVRMRPLSDVTNRFPRALRELSLQYQKPVQLKLKGEQLLIDRNILEALSEPLMHLLRNAFDHGIEIAEIRAQQGKPEQGTIQIEAVNRQNRTVITVSDDGAGIPIDKIRSRARQMGLDEMLLAGATDDELLSLIFEPGFTTSDRVTALSGRGVGMDVVRERLKQIQGEISVSTQAGRGTTFTLSVPFTLSVARVLLAESRGFLFAFPTEAIEEISVVQPDQIFSTAGSEAFEWNGSMVQLVVLSRWLHFHRPIQPESLETSASISVPTVLMLNQNNQWVGLQVDRCWGEQEVAIRHAQGGFPMPPGFNGCAILGDGRVVPMVNAAELLYWITSCERTRDAEQRLLVQGSPNQPAAPVPMPMEQQPTVLIVDDSINVRRFLALTLEKAGYQVAQAKDGQDAIDKLAAGLTVQAVICDIEMPRLDGYEFLARVKSTPTLKEIPVAMLTSRSGEKHRHLAMRLGATAYFSKPYNEQTLLQTLEKMLDLSPAV